MLNNTKTAYGWVAILLHWIMALAILGMFGLGLYMVELTYYDAWYKGSLYLHKSIGILLFGLLLFRTLWRGININPDSADKYASKFEVTSAHLVHLGLYLLMFTLMISGYLISTADGRGIMVFEIFNVPAFPLSVANQEDIAGEIHEILAWVLVLLAGVHALAAVKHHVINKNKTLVRMLKVQTTENK
ncbi:cytochrome b [Moritella yayanosii]|uniref:Putative cytochrome b561 yceJ n=1 Tax=Moritella yayanosii TaxID=69539 RepID=A0A330LJ68_9GAMM|nr:cytochrome b [Moritella yayanosii]SQD77034.1 putative cytochrome b561 yceJ [Moritella yayanosii]